MQQVVREILSISTAAHTMDVLRYEYLISEMSEGEGVIGLRSSECGFTGAHRLIYQTITRPI